MTVRGAPSATEHAGGRGLDSMSAREIAAAVIGGEAAISAALAPELPAIAEAIDAIAVRLSDGGRLVLAGAGTSGRLCLLQAAELGPTFGIGEGSVVGLLAGVPAQPSRDSLLRADPAAEDDAGAGVAAISLAQVTNRDAVVAVAASGSTAWTVAALDAAAREGALAIAVTCAHPSALGSVASIAIHPLIGPEVLVGSTRLAAASACKAVLDALTTGAMVRLGHVYRDRMVDVKVSNQKLRDRAIRMVADLTRRPDEEARAALESVGWWARAAIVRLELGLDAQEARTWAAAHPQLAEALDDRRGR
jgi:N-acetylmuramic acid 6-phosphate etherase